MSTPGFDRGPIRMELVAAILTGGSLLLLVWHVSRSTLRRARQAAGAKSLVIPMPHALLTGITMVLVIGAALALTTGTFLRHDDLMSNITGIMLFINWSLFMFNLAAGILMFQAGVEIRQHGILWCSGLLTRFFPYHRIKHCAWAADRQKLVVQTGWISRRLPVPARHQKDVNAALAPYVEVRSSGGSVISRPPPPTAASALSANEGNADTAQVASFRPQFGLKTMLLLVLTVGFGCSWAAVHFKPYREQMRIVSELERFNPEASWIGDQLYSLDFSGSDVKIGDEQLSQLARLTTLETLDLGDCPITDEGLRHLSHLPRLKLLMLNGTRVTDAGLVHLETLPHLTYVSLWRTNVTDGGAEKLRQALPGVDVKN